MKPTGSRALLMFGTLIFFCIGISALAQSTGGNTPCGVAVSGFPLNVGHGLMPVDGGTIVYDSNQGLCWLGDANLSGHPEVRANVRLAILNRDGSAPVINPDGTMDYETALNWVSALNGFNNGRGWLGHSNWQLPSVPAMDGTCSSKNVDNFGVSCTEDAMGNLYSVGLARAYPDSVVPWFFNIVWPFFSLHPGLYWTTDTNSGGQVTFSFNSGVMGANTTKYNHFHVLPMTHAVLGAVPAGVGVLPYLTGPAVGRAVYDTHTGLSWTLDANLPALNRFGVTGTTSITSIVNGSTLTVPLIDKDGAVYFSAVDPTATSGWIVSMNKSNYAGTGSWTLPCLGDLMQLYNDLGLKSGDTRMEWSLFTGPFWRLQPGFYWACERDSRTGSNAPCDLSLKLPQVGVTPMEWSFNFDDGFLGTDQNDKQFYVMVYYPAP